LTRKNLEATGREKIQCAARRSSRQADSLESTEDTDVRASRIAEVDVFEPNVALAGLEGLARRILGVDFGARVHQVDGISSGATSL
jgi:hypothetical protein